MTDLKQAAQQALDALVTCCAEEWRTLNNFGMKQVYDEKKVNAAIAALHAALAEPDSDYERGFVDGMNLQTKGSVDKAVNRMAQTTHWEGCEAVHPECRKPEPVAWELRMGKTDRVLMEITNNRERAHNWRASLCEVVPLYYAPTPRKPLSDDEFISMLDSDGIAIEPELAFIIKEMVERAHGIGEQT